MNYGESLGEDDDDLCEVVKQYKKGKMWNLALIKMKVKMLYFTNQYWIMMHIYKVSMIVLIYITKVNIKNIRISMKKMITNSIDFQGWSLSIKISITIIRLSTKIAIINLSKKILIKRLSRKIVIMQL